MFFFLGALWKKMQWRLQHFSPCTNIFMTVIFIRNNSCGAYGNQCGPKFALLNCWSHLIKKNNTTILLPFAIGKNLFELWLFSWVCTSDYVLAFDFRISEHHLGIVFLHKIQKKVLFSWTFSHMFLIEVFGPKKYDILRDQLSVVHQILFSYVTPQKIVSVWYSRNMSKCITPW